MNKKFYLIKKRKPFTLGRICVVVLLGMAIGFINGFFGGGAGMIVVPLLTYAFNLNDKQSHATALTVILTLCTVSSIIYISNDYLNWEQTLWIGLGAIVGGLIGAMLLKKLPNKAIRIIFSILMITAGIKMII